MPYIYTRTKTKASTIQVVYTVLWTVAFWLMIVLNAHALCPNCDTTAPGYGNSTWDQRYNSGKSQQGDGRTPYDRPESNIERYNREYQREQEAREERQRQERQQQQYRPYGQPHSKATSAVPERLASLLPATQGNNSSERPA